MRIAQVCHRYVPSIGGIEFYAQRLIKDSLKRGIGLILNRLDEHLLAEKLLALFQNRALAKRLGRKGRLTVKNHYHWPDLSKKYRTFMKVWTPDDPR
jgi:glycosyltransferase involved in cell wall biosynthesis